jgi:hypothetical protein
MIAKWWQTMALFDGDGFEDLVNELKQYSDLISKAAPDMLDAGAAVVAEAWRDAIRAHGLIDTGDMLDSVGPSDAVNTSTEKKISVYPQGSDRKGVRNAEKAFINHYGASRRKATHFVDDAETKAEGPAVDAMAAVWYEKLESEG